MMNYVTIASNDVGFRIYAITKASDAEALLKLSTACSLSLVEADDLLAIVSEIDAESGGVPTESRVASCNVGTIEQLNAFSQSIADLHRIVDILPFRFAKSIALDEVRELLRTQHICYRNNLKRIAGCTEINARWVISAATADDDQNFVAPSARLQRSGSDYLRAKYRASKREREYENELAQQVLAMGRENRIECIELSTSLRTLKEIEQRLHLSNCTETSTSTRACCVAGIELLVRRETALTYLRALSQLRFHDRLPAVCSGPWAPYSFIGDERTAIATAPMCAQATAAQVQKRANSLDTAPPS